jgi:hypothetical protein
LMSEVSGIGLSFGMKTTKVERLDHLKVARLGLNET